MADAYNQTISGEAGAATLGANTRKANQVYNTGTRQLAFLQLSVTCVTDDIATNYTDPDSNFSKLMRILQQRVEIYGVGQPSGTEVTIIISKDSLALTEAEEADPGDNADIIKDTIEAESALFSSAFVQWGSKISGWSIENDC
jgi:hypothetical protein